MKTYYFDEPQLEHEITKIKNLILQYLYANKHITKEVYNDFSLNYGIIVKKPTFFSKLWAKKNVSQKTQYIIVEQLTIPNFSEDGAKPDLSIVHSNDKKGKE